MTFHQHPYAARLGITASTSAEDAAFLILRHVRDNYPHLFDKMFSQLPARLQGPIGKKLAEDMMKG